LGPILFSLIILYLMWHQKNRGYLWFLIERVIAGYIIFWVFYILFPAFLNLLNPIEGYWTSYNIFNSFGSSEISVGALVIDPFNFFKYFVQFLANTIAIYFFYPFTLFPIIFILGPLISCFVLWRQLRKASGDNFFSKLHQLQFEIEASPTEMIKERLTNRDWGSQKDLLKILLVMLPISLYLLMTLMKVTGFQEKTNILQGTSLGWFLEIFFVYLAMVMFGVHLLYSGRISFKGDYIGLRVRDAMVQSLSTVGTFISILAVGLFLVDYSRQIFVVLYFVGYFVMVTLIFIIFLDIFEPLSIFLLMKIVETIKNYGPSEVSSVSEQLLQTDEQPKYEIYVPEINLEELSEEVAHPELKHERPVEEKTETIAIVPEQQENIVQESITSKITLRHHTMNDLFKYGSMIVLSLLLMWVTAQIIVFVIKLPAFESISQIIARSQYTLIIIYFFLIVLFLPSLLLPVLIISKKYLIPTLIAVFAHIFLIAVDFTLRNFLILLNTNTKFSEVAYQTFYYYFLYISILLILGSSILLIRRFQWDVFPNITIIVVAGIFVAIIWVFLFLPNIQISIKNFNLIIFPTYDSNAPYFNISGLIDNTLPGPSFNNFIQELIPYIYGQPGKVIWNTFIFQPTLLNAGSVFYIPFITEVPVNFSPLLGIFSMPFKLFRDFCNVGLFALFFFFLGKEFLTVIVQKDEKGSILEKNIFSVSDNIPDLKKIIKKPEQYAIIRNFGLEPLIDEYGQPTGRELSPLESAIYNMELGEEGQLGQIILEFTGQTPISFVELSETTQTNLKDILNFFNFINKTHFAKETPFTVIRREYGYEFEEAKIDSLHIMMTDGRSVFTHSFTEESSVEPALVAGLFSAITSFAKEAVRAEKLLRTIDHGDVVLIIEYGKYVFAAIFVDRNSIELRNKLAQFLQEFESKHEEDLENWLGDTSTFSEDWQLVEDIFGINR
ncbi:MAG: hypothetical protein ACFFD1_13660, partial [Candidatus Thorarchaeota archaeon]